MISSNLYIRPFEAQDLEGMHQLGLRCFPQDRWSIIGETWRFITTPAGVIPGMIALDRDRIVASYTAWPITLHVGGETVQGAQSINTMTHPDYRGRGLFVKLAAATCEMLAGLDYKLIYGFPNEQSYPGFIRHLDWFHVSDVPILKRLLVPVPDVLDPISLVSPSTWQKQLKCDTRWVVSDEIVSPSDLAALAFKRNEFNIRLRRDTLWFSWRYSTASQHTYKTLSTRLAGHLEAVVIYRREDCHAIIAETLGGSDALQAVIAELMKQARRQGIRVVATLTTDPIVVDVLQKAGFWFRGHERLIAKQLSSYPLKSDIHDLGQWTLYGGDHDVY